MKLIRIMKDGTRHEHRILSSELDVSLFDITNEQYAASKKLIVLDEGNEIAVLKNRIGSCMSVNNKNLDG